MGAVVSNEIYEWGTYHWEMWTSVKNGSASLRMRGVYSGIGQALEEGDTEQRCLVICSRPKLVLIARHHENRISC